MSDPRAPASGFLAPRRASRGQLSTARGLAMFRDELTDAGFDPAVVTELVIVACQADINASGLNVAEPPEK